jgi:RNA polymerase sigma-70 factor, ECF subfamily
MVPAGRDAIPSQPSSGAADREFESIFAAQSGYVGRTLRRLGVHEVDLEDVTHEVFLAVHKQRARYDGSRPIRPWLFAFAMRIASDYRRLSRHRVTTIDLSGLADGAVLPEEQVIVREGLEAVALAIDRLPRDRRVVFVLHDVDGTPIPRIATTLAIPTNTAYSRLRLARREFAAAMRRLWPKELAPASE